MTPADPLAAAYRWVAQGRTVALATVVSTWGSAPRPEGSMMAIDTDGHFEGSVSGGCVEAAVLDAAREVITTGEGRRLRFGVSNEDSWEVGLACGGTIEIWLERIGPGFPLDAMRAASARGGGETFALDLDSGAWSVGPGSSAGASQVFEHTIRPPIRVVIVGAVHLAQHLVPMVRAAGYEVTVLDPRSAFAAPDRFPDVELLQAWPEEGLAQCALDDRTAVVLLTHDPKLDDPALVRALDSDAFYIGALGSRRTHAQRVDRLRSAGVPESELARIHAPVGLAIGARTPGEIAAAILAEVVREARAAVAGEVAT